MAAQWSHCFGVGSPISFRGSTDGIQDGGCPATVGAFAEDKGRLFILTFYTGKSTARLKVLDIHLVWKEVEPPVGDIHCASEESKVCLVEVNKKMQQLIPRNQRYITDLYGEECRVEKYYGNPRDLVGLEVQSIQKGGYRYGKILEYRRRDSALLARNVIPGVEFSDESDRGALITSLPIRGVVTAYGVITGNEAGVSRVHIIGADLDRFSKDFFGGEEIKICCPVKRFNGVD